MPEYDCSRVDCRKLRRLVESGFSPAERKRLSLVEGSPREQRLIQAVLKLAAKCCADDLPEPPPQEKPGDNPLIAAALLLLEKGTELGAAGGTGAAAETGAAGAGASLGPALIILVALIVVERLAGEGRKSEICDPIDLSKLDPSGRTVGDAGAGDDTVITPSSGGTTGPVMGIDNGDGTQTCFYRCRISGRFLARPQPSNQPCPLIVLPL